MSFGTGSATLVGSSIPARSRTRDALHFNFVQRQGGGQMPVASFPEGTSQSFEAGQWLIYENSTGRVIEATDGVAGVLGLALKDASGVAGTSVPVILALPDCVFRGTCHTPSNLSAAQVGDLVDLNVTIGIHLVDENASTDDVFRIVSIPTGALTSTNSLYGKVDVVVASSMAGQFAEEPI
jgi:hypothetical protein